MYENIRFKYPYICLVEGTYYYIDYDYQVLIAKTSSGKVLFTYPLASKLPSEALKLCFNGVYFFSLHKIHNQIFIYKWFIDKEFLTLKYIYNYSSIGLLSSENTTYRKYFNYPIAYDGWVEGSNVANASFYIDNNELLVYSFGDNISNWRGPYITKEFSLVEDFRFQSKFYVDISSSNTYVNFIFYNNTTIVFQCLFTANLIKLYYGSSLIYSGESFIVFGTHNTFVLKRYEDNIELFLNDASLYYGNCSLTTINKSRLAIYRYSNYNPIASIRVNSLVLNSYDNLHKIDTETLDIDNYNASFSAPAPKNALYIDLEGELNDITPGTVLSLSSYNSSTFEEVTVTGTISNNRYGLSFGTLYAHTSGEPVKYSKNVYLFNKYTFKTLSSSIYKLNFFSGALEEVYESVLYDQVKATTLFKWKTAYLLGFVKSTNFLALDIKNNMVIYSSMNMDNIKQDNTTVIDIKDINICYGSIYRLQNEATYYGTTYSWNTYNYQLSPIRAFVDSITIEAYPKILSSDGRSQVKVSAIVKDQYAKPLPVTKVEFSDDDSIGYMTLRDRYTGVNGTTYNYYRSGLVPRTVHLSVEAIQEY